jgi:hypothetical protein
MLILMKYFCLFLLRFIYLHCLLLQLHTVAKTAGMHHSEWVENADRLVAGFLEKFEEGCHMMVVHIK